MKKDIRDKFVFSKCSPESVEAIYDIRIRDAALCGDNEKAFRLMKIRNIAVKVAKFNKDKHRNNNDKERE